MNDLLYMIFMFKYETLDNLSIYFCFSFKDNREILFKRKMIRIATLEDAKQICDLYNYYISNSTSTFEETPLGK